MFAPEQDSEDSEQCASDRQAEEEGRGGQECPQEKPEEGDHTSLDDENEGMDCCSLVPRLHPGGVAWERG